MKLVEKHKLPQASDDTWLYDTAQAVKPLSDTLHIMFGKQAKDSKRNKPSEYRPNAIQLRETFYNRTRRASTARGSIFNTEFGESEDLKARRGQAQAQSKKKLP